MGVKAVEQLLKKTGNAPEDIDLLICTTVTPDYLFPSTASIISYEAKLKNAWAFDLMGACSGFLYGIETARSFIETGRYKKVILVSAEKMSSITNYEDRTTCPLFGDAGTAVLLEPTEENVGVIDSDLHTDGIGKPYLLRKAGGSAHPSHAKEVANIDHFIYQEGRFVFKHAVSKMAGVSVNMMKKHDLTPETLAWLIPHQANLRIIDATAHHMNLAPEKVMINIERYGNTTSATIPLCLWEWEKTLKKGDNLILSAFGAGFTWGAVYIKWAYDS
jgi:3-oxoacyl-[acyl-carrier-protein] synthase-3